LAIAASLLIARRSDGTVTAARAAKNARLPPMSSPRAADQTVAEVALQ
jgi:hypothetical protein